MYRSRACLSSVALLVAVVLAIASHLPSAAAPTVGINTNQGTYTADDVIRVYLSAENPDEGMNVSVYIGFLDPQGSLFTMQGGTYVENIVPWVDQIWVPSGFSMTPTEFWTYPVPCANPLINKDGQYHFAIAFGRVGVFELVSEIDFASFFVNDIAGTPIAVIESITPNPATQWLHSVDFVGRGTDDGEIVAYEWNSSLDGYLSNQAEFSEPAVLMSVGMHEISFKVLDDEGNWSKEAVGELSIIPAGPKGNIDGIVRDSTNGQTVGGAEVRIDDNWSIADSEGQYILYNIPVGDHDIKAESPGYQFYSQTIQVQEGANSYDINLSPLTQTTYLHGTVRDYQYQPVQAAKVEVNGQTTYTDGSGYYQFAAVTAGRRTLTVTDVACHRAYSAELVLSEPDVTEDVSLSLLTPDRPPEVYATAASLLVNYVQWGPVDCAAGYNVYASTDGGVSSTLLNSTPITQASYVHNLETNCYDLSYAVTAVGLDGELESPRTEWVDVIPIRALEVDAEMTLSGQICFESDVLVHETGALTVEEGSRLEFGPGCGMIVNGTLTAQGNRRREISFERMDSELAWGSLEFHGSLVSSQSLLSYVEFSGAGADGTGAVYCRSASPTIEDCDFTSNEATNGAGILCEDGSAPTINDCFFDSNTATAYGGAICCLGSSSPAITNNIIRDNSSGDYGGGIYCEQSSPSISGNTIVGNDAGTNGGGICCLNGCDCAITQNTISQNVADGEGGGIHSLASTSWIAHNVISNNTATTHGGGVYYGPVMFGSRLGKANSPVIFNCLIVSNSAIGEAGAVYSSELALQVYNCTIADNVCEAGTGGIYSVASGGASIFDCILWGNGDELGNCTCTYCCVEDPELNEGNIGDNPLFVSGSLDSYYLGTDSPCVDAGSRLASEAGLQGWFTQTSGSGDQGQVDMGYHR